MVLWAAVRGRLLCHSAAESSGQRPANANTYGRKWRPRALEPAAGDMRRPLHVRGPDSADRGLHTSGPNSPDRDSDIRMDMLGLSAVGSGSGRSKESDADQAWMELVGGGGYGELNRHWPGRQRCAVKGKWCYSWPRPMLPLGYRTASRLPFTREALRVCESPF